MSTVIDFADWLKDVSQLTPLNNPDFRLGVVSLGVGLLLLALAVWKKLGLLLRKGRFVAVSRLLFLAVSIAMLILSGFAFAHLAATRVDARDLFQHEAEKRFGVQSLALDREHWKRTWVPLNDPKSILPPDRTPCSWFHDGQLHQGMVVVEGSKVGLFESDTLAQVSVGS